MATSYVVVVGCQKTGMYVPTYFSVQVYLPYYVLYLRYASSVKKVELHPICLPVGWPVSVSYRPLSVGIFGMVLHQLIVSTTAEQVRKYSTQECKLP